MVAPYHILASLDTLNARFLSLFFFFFFINIWGIPQQGIGLPWSRWSPNNVDDMHEQVMPVLVNVSECKREAWCWEWEREGSMGVAVKRIDTETMTI